jgi:hypothetical protein
MCQGAGVDFRELDPLSKKRLTVTKVFGELWHWKEQVTPFSNSPSSSWVMMAASNHLVDSRTYNQ